MSEEKDLPEVKADKKGSKKEEPVKESKLEVVQPQSSSKSCSCGCQEKLQKLIDALLKSHPTVIKQINLMLEGEK